MRLTKGLVVGILGALLAGGVEAGTEWAVETSQANGNAPTITIPGASIGDAATYQPFLLNLTNQEWVKDPGQFSYKFLELATVPDRTGSMRDTAVLGRRFGYDEWDRAAGAGGLEMRMQGSRDRLEYVDLGTKAIVSSATQTSSDFTYLFVQQAKEEISSVRFGPRVPWGVLDWEDDRYYKANEVILQGHTFRVGESYPELAQEYLSSYAVAYGGQASFRFTEVSLDVPTSGVFDGKDAIAIRMRTCLDADLMDRPNAPKGFTWITWTVPLPADICLEQVRWFAADTPYSLLTESTMHVNGTHFGSQKSLLVGLERGTTPIPWTEPTPFLTDLPNAERSPDSQRFPADGRGLSLVYPLSNAIAAIADDVRLANFRVWTSQNPGAILVGAHMYPVGEDGADAHWDLAYGTPAGNAFVVATEQKGAQRIQMEVGAVSMPPFALEEVPTGIITFAEAERQWRRIQAGNEAPTPNQIHWGAWVDPVEIQCYEIAVCAIAVNAPPTSHEPPQPYVGEFLSWMSFGYTVQSKPTRAGGVVYTEPWLYSTNYVTMDPESGVLIDAGLRYREYDLAVPSARAPDEPAEVTAVPPMATSIDVGRAAWVSGSVFVILLLAYFLPALKFAGTQGLMLFPGYAKLHKDDILNNRARETILNAIRGEPGITPPELQKMAGTGWGTTVYHLSVLEKNKLVSSLLDGRHKRFFPTGNVNFNDRARLAVLKNMRTKQLYELIMQEPGIDTHDAAKRLGISRPGVYWHVERLEGSKLVGRDRESRRVRYFPLEERSLPDPRAIEVA